MVQKSVRDFQKHLQSLASSVQERMKRATTATADYGFVKKPETETPVWHVVQSSWPSNIRT